MTLLEIALQCAARGWYVFPCKPREKYPITQNGWHDASRDEAKIRAWWMKTPNANVGIACGMSGLTVLDIDSGLTCEADAHNWLNTHRIQPTYAVRSGRRPGYGLQVYFSGPIPDVHGWESDICKGDVKSLGGYVLAAGSVHPSGETYEVMMRLYPERLEPTPGFVRSLRSPNTGTGKNLEPVVGGRHAYLTSVAGKMRNAGLGVEAMEVALLQHNADVCQPPLPEDDVKHIAKSVGRYDVPEIAPVAVIGSPTVEVTSTEDAEDMEQLPRPRYPDDVWDGTAYGEFADLCTQNNFIPKRFFSESLRTVVGAIVGDRLTCPYSGVNPRAYTIKIAPPGSGKGTSDEYVRLLFEERWDGLQRTEGPLLWSDPKELGWRTRGIGAQAISPASAPGLLKSIEERKPKKNETVNPLEQWKPIPRIITMSEEVRSLFANFANESTGAGLESVLCELFDRNSFTATVTKDRSPASGKLMYSLLGGITKEGWDSVFSKVESVESGFLSRVNIIGTEETRTVAGVIPPDLEPLRRKFFPLLLDLEANPRELKPEPGALALMNQWYSELELPEGVSKARLNIHAWRTALHLAWLRGHAHILSDDVDKGTKVANFQAKMREFYAPPEGETRGARCEAAIRKVMRSRRRVPLRQLRRMTNSNRYGIGLWDKALKSLVQAGELRIAEEANQRKVCILLRIKE